MALRAAVVAFPGAAVVSEAVVVFPGAAVVSEAAVPRGVGNDDFFI